MPPPPGIESFIFMPQDVPQSNFIECRAYGANVTLVDGLISDCARIVSQRKDSEGWFEVSTLKEPYRIEGKKTMGYELAEQLDWKLPDAIFYPTGGGVGLIGMWKAFAEMEALGWIGPERPKMIAVQADGCQPIVRAFEAGRSRAASFSKALTRWPADCACRSRWAISWSWTPCAKAGARPSRSAMTS